MKEIICVIEFVKYFDVVLVVSVKIMGMVCFFLLESFQKGELFIYEICKEYKSVLKCLDFVCYVGCIQGVSIFFDVEESWI